MGLCVLSPPPLAPALTHTRALHTQPAAYGSSPDPHPLNTLDEPVRETVLRDVRRVGANLLLVAFPCRGGRDAQTAALRNWDLWGPMVRMMKRRRVRESKRRRARARSQERGTIQPIHPSIHPSIYPSIHPSIHPSIQFHAQTFALVLALILSAGSPKPSTVFSLVFGVCAAGAVVLTANVGLLGGNIGFFQSLCLLGYCLFPLAAAAGAATLIPLPPVRWAVVGVGLGWSVWAALPFIGGSVPPARRALAVYPLLLLYATLGWLAVVK